MTKDAPPNEDVRWWKLYRQERKRLGKAWRDTLTTAEITRAAREATRRFNEGAR